MKDIPIGQVPLAQLQKDGTEFGQVRLAQIDWYHHIHASKVSDDAERAEKLFEDVASSLPQIEEMEDDLDNNENCDSRR